MNTTKYNAEYHRQKALEYYYRNREAILAKKSSPEVRAIRRSAEKAYYKKNRNKVLAYKKAWNAAHAEQTRAAAKAYSLKDRPRYLSQRRKYHLAERKLTPEKYEELLFQQQGLCAICARPPKKGKRLAVDHDHLTDTNRGLLCDRCNMGLGLFRDSMEILEKAKHYLAGSLAAILAKGQVN